MCIQGTGRLFPGEQGGAAAHEEPKGGPSGQVRSPGVLTGT